MLINNFYKKRCKMKKILFYLIVVFSFSSLDAKAKDSWNIKRVVDETKSKNYELKAEKEKINVSKTEEDIAKALPNPSFLTDLSPVQNTYRIGFSTLIETGNKRNLRQDEAKLLNILVNQEFDLKEFEILNQAKRSYIDLFNLKAKKQKISEITSSIETLTKVAKDREKAGDIPIFDVMQTELLSLNTKIELDKASYEFQQEKNKLENFTLSKISEDSILEEPKNTKFKDKELNLVDLEKALIEKNLEMKLFDTRILILEKQMDTILSKNIPDLNVSTGSDFMTDQSIQSGMFINLNVEMPILYRQEGQVKQLESLITKTEKEKDFTLNRLKFELKNAYHNYSVAYDRKKLYEKELLPKSEEIVKKAYLSFQYGKTNIISTITTQQSHITLQLNYLQIISDYQKAILDLERITGCI